MNIQELNLIGFGKFNNKKIYLKNKINIIYGENEAGKTTIHNFIDGMFYGFLKPYVKNTLYLEEHERYTPWNNSNYSGIIKFEYFSKGYIIERNFTKSQESTRVLLDSTGEDITLSINSGNNGRILQPGFHFMGFNNAVYSNTVSIKQLELRTDSKLANELREKLVNVTSTLDENISIEQSINELNKVIKSIGSVKAPTSVYSKEYSRLIRLKEEKEEILSFKKDYEELLEENDKIDNNIKIYNSNIREIQSRILNANIIELRNLYYEGKNLEDEISNLQIKAENYKKFNPLSMDDYSKCINITNNIEHLDIKIRELIRTLEHLDNEINNLRIQENNSFNVDENIQNDYNYFEEVEDENNKLLQNNNSNKLEFIKRDYNSNYSLRNSINILIFVSGLLFLAILTFSLINNKIGLLTINIGLLIILIYGFTKKRKINEILKTIEFEKNELEFLEEENKIKIIENEKNMISILNKHSIQNKLEFKRLIDDIGLKAFKQGQLEKDLSRNIEKSLSIQEDLELAKGDKLSYEDQLSKLLEGNNSLTLEDFKIGLGKKQIYEEVLEKIKGKKDLYERILGNSNLEDILNELENFGDYSKIEEVLTSEELDIKLNNLQDELNISKINKKGIESNFENINQKVSNLVNVEEEISRGISRIKHMDNKKEALELAKNTIEELSKDIHKQFAPAINQRVGKIIKQITDGKYNHVKIDNKLEMGVGNPITGEIINVNALSGGTIDQLYFALRFGIIKSMADNKLPLILDDCFIQYDNIRLENILRFLEGISKERQIILFTCQSREMELLDSMDIDYNLIKL